MTGNGVAFDSTVLGNLGLDEAELARMRENEAPADPKLADNLADPVELDEFLAPQAWS
ncbi:MAG TPA: hypothetical protein VF081_13500 [Solirubrobacterales bacterium]